MARLKPNSTVGGKLIATSQDSAIIFRKNTSTNKMEYSKDKGTTWTQIGG